MAEFTLDLQESIHTIEQRRVAHGWVTKLADDLLHKSEDGKYAEFTLGTDGKNIAEALDLMALGDLLVRPGDRLGKVYAAEYDSDYPEHDDKMSVHLGGSFLVPHEPNRVFVAATSEQFGVDEDPLRYIAIGLEYVRGQETFRQLIGLAAHPDEHVDALRLEYGESTNGAGILKKGRSRSVSYDDTWAFVDCLRELFVLQPDQLV
jgi:hypothetical protein